MSVVIRHQSNQTRNEIVNKLKGSSLVAIPVDGDVFVLESLNDEIAHHSSVVGVHARAKCIEDSGDSDINIGLLLIGIPVKVEEVAGEGMVRIENRERSLHHRFCDTFPFVVTSSRADWVHIAPVSLLLGMDFWIAIHLGGGGEEDSGSHSLGESEHVQSSLGVCLDRFDRIVLVMWWGSRASKMIDLIHLKEDWFHNIVDDQLEVWMALPLLDIHCSPCEHIINDNDTMALHHQAINKMASDKSSPTSDQDAELVTRGKLGDWRVVGSFRRSWART